MINALQELQVPVAARKIPIQNYKSTDPNCPKDITEYEYDPSTIVAAEALFSYPSRYQLHNHNDILFTTEYIQRDDRVMHTSGYDLHDLDLEYCSNSCEEILHEEDDEPEFPLPPIPFQTE